MQSCLLKLIKKSSLVFTCDDHGMGQLIFCGDELQEITGYALEELKQLPNNWFSIIHPDDKMDVLKVRKVLLAEPLNETEQTYRIITSNNKTRIIRERSCMAINAEQQQEVTSIMTDITGDVSDQAKHHILESETRYRSLFEHSPIGMLIIDIDDTKRAIATNPKWMEFMKSDMNTIMNANMLEFSPELQPGGELSSTKLGEILAKYRANRQAISFEWQFKDREDRLRDMQVKFYPIVVDGKEQTIMFSNDITQLKKTERALRAALEKAQESDNLKSAFLANFSHEIRTPLNSVTGFSEMLGLSNLDEAERKSFVELIKQNVEGLLITIEEIIEISKIEAGQLTFQYTILKPFEICQMVYHINRLKSMNKGIQFAFDADISEQDISITIDKTKLLYILNHLIDNAIKFTTAGQVDFWYTTSDDHIEFVIKDTGKGIAKENQAAIFQSFRQLENPYTKEHEGLGLGLPVIRGYVEGLLGTIRLESTLGKGTTFYVKLQLDSSITLPEILPKNS